MSKFFAFRCLFIILIFIIYYKFIVFAKSSETDAIAALKNLKGFVKVETESSKKGKYAREGMLLFSGDKILTLPDSKASILYRDGSRVRLFQNSSLTLDFSEEQLSNNRKFRYKLNLQNGSMRGRFRKGLQFTKIRTPTAIIGIKGTSFRILEKKNNTTVSLTEGLLEVSNLSSKVVLNTGQWLSNFDSNTDLSKKISPLPSLISIKTNVYEFDFNDKKSKQTEIRVQIQNRISGRLVKRSGFLAFESNYQKVNLPRRILLNKMGFTKFLLWIDPPSLKEKKFIGLIKIRFYMDEPGFEDVADGLLVLKINNFRRTRNLLLHPEEGLLEKE